MLCKGSTGPMTKCSLAINGRQPSARLLHLSLTVTQVRTPQVIYRAGEPVTHYLQNTMALVDTFHAAAESNSTGGGDSGQLAPWGRRAPEASQSPRHSNGLPLALFSLAT
ncbi:hypothetical protein Baya_10129 [Bagarius yarrelli]|uniref:Uncharacterized protein n=1 Tax=Bagarius yarrelli TaxID=175774 RepID=A0A556UEY3_BAGYA|nr:hypothetical protein Baya_10129 [Bagarius yarrelli]